MSKIEDDNLATALAQTRKEAYDEGFQDAIEAAIKEIQGLGVQSLDIAIDAVRSLQA